MPAEYPGDEAARVGEEDVLPLALLGGVEGNALSAVKLDDDKTGLVLAPAAPERIVVLLGVAVMPGKELFAAAAAAAAGVVEANVDAALDVSTTTVTGVADAGVELIVVNPAAADDTAPDAIAVTADAADAADVADVADVADIADATAGAADAGAAVVEPGLHTFFNARHSAPQFSCKSRSLFSRKLVPVACASWYSNPDGIVTSCTNTGTMRLPSVSAMAC